MRRFAAMLVALALGSAAEAQAPPKPLFASDELLRLTISGPVGQIARGGAKSREPRDAVLTVAGAAPETLPIQLSPRGITRLKRDVCQFPPLRVSLKGAPPAGSLFSGQKRLKLVTHCRPAAGFQQHLLLEYAAYRLYNRMTPASFKARLAMIDYVDEAGRPITTRYGFFIEDIDDVAARNGTRHAATGDRIAASQLSQMDAARAALFEYMIGNLDWSIRAGPPGEGCCHNSRLIGPVSGKLVAVPYDFDYSGLVNAPYAVAPDGTSSVTTRRYQGFCTHNSEAVALAAAMGSQRGALLSALDTVPLEPPVRRRATAFLNSFFAEIADLRKASAKMLKTCVN